MNVYYIANQVYQYSYAKPIFDKIGGTFIATKWKKVARFKYHMKNGNCFPEIKTWRNTPPIIYQKKINLSELEGVFISQSNARIHRDPNIATSIFLGHGTGDKLYGGNARILESYDYHFLSGPKHFEKLKDSHLTIPDQRLIKIGNPRFDKYVTGGIDRDSYADRLGISDKSRTNVLYAPTWKWGNGTLHKFIRRFCRELNDEYNLIIRPHFFERRYIPIYKVWTYMNGFRHVYFSNPADIINHDTMYDFAVSDILISDTSSITYEYLITGNPIIIIKTDHSDLHTMPEDMDINTITDTYDGQNETKLTRIIKRNLENKSNNARYNQLLDNCFYFNDGHSTDRAVNFIRNL